MHLYLKHVGTLHKVAGQVGSIAFRGWRPELRDGLDLGGGEYYKFERSGVEIVLVCNDAEHPEVYVEERKEYPFYFYSHGRMNGDKALEEVRESLAKSGLTCKIHEDT